MNEVLDWLQLVQAMAKEIAEVAIQVFKLFGGVVTFGGRMGKMKQEWSFKRTILEIA